MHSHAYRLFITHCLTDFIFTFKTGRRNYTTAFNTALLLHVSFSLQSYLIVQREKNKFTDMHFCNLSSLFIIAYKTITFHVWIRKGSYFSLWGFRTSTWLLTILVATFVATNKTKCSSRPTAIGDQLSLPT